MKKYIIILVIAFPLLFTQCIKDETPIIETPASSDIELYVNEVLSTGDPDWIEIYNGSSEAVDMEGFKISDGPAAKYTFPAGTIIPANGYLVYPCNEFGLSSGGEEVYLWDNENNLIDNITFPALDAGVAYGRTTDGGDVFATMSPTSGAPNSIVNNPPLLTATAIESINDNEAYELEVVASDADGIRDVKLFMETESGLTFVEMAPLGGGDYKYIIEPIAEGTVVEYYIVATDETGKKSYFPEGGPDDKLSVTVADGLPVFLDVEFSNENPSDLEDIDVTVTIFDKGGDTEVRIYYVIDDAIADDKEKVTLTTTDNVTYTGTLPGQVDGSVIHYYLRAEENTGLGQQAYFPMEEYDVDGNIISDFDHDVETTWPTLTVAPLVILDALVINEIQGAGAPDYIELYNGTGAEIDLAGYKLHDSDPTEAYTIPSGTTIAAGGFYTLDCDGAAVTLFKVSSGGEDITLLDAAGAEVDKLLITEWPDGHLGLVARKKDAAEQWGIATVETKGTTNN